MKKIIAVTVLLVLLSAAVFAQDGSGWKIGFSAQFIQDLVYTTHKTAESKDEETVGSTTTTTKTELGKYIKGQTEVFGLTDISGFDHDRLLLSLSNSGEHHNFYVDIAYDDSWASGQWCNVSIWNLLQSGPADWYFQGDTGASGSKIVLEGKVGTGRYDGWVNRIDIWDDYIGGGDQNFFGVYRFGNGSNNPIPYSGTDTFGLLPSDTIGAADFIINDPWSRVFAVGITYDNKFKLSLGKTLTSYATGSGDETASKSKVELSAILSGRPADLLTFDVSYAINGKDGNTAARGTGGAWENLVGAYVGLDLGTLGISGLGVSAGYTANFTAYEKQAEFENSKDERTYDKTGPVYSGIDLNVQYNGIDKLGISLKNNISFASAEYKFRETYKGGTEVVGLDSWNVSGKDDSETQNAFVYRARLSASYGLTDNLSVVLSLQDILGVYSTDQKVKASDQTKTSKDTSNALITSLHANYNVGNVSFGLGLTLKVESGSTEKETTRPNYTKKETGSSAITTFHVPIFFKVSI